MSTIAFLTQLFAMTAFYNAVATDGKLATTTNLAVHAANQCRSAMIAKKGVFFIAKSTGCIHRYNGVIYV